MLNTLIKNRLSGLVALLILLSAPGYCRGGDDEADEIPTRYGMAAVLGHVFDPVDDINFVELSGFAMWDYDKVWHHWAPDALRWKLEGTAGITTSPQTDAMASVGMTALYYLDFISGRGLSPYIEGGIGLIYTSFRVEGQGSHFNFHPQIGVGTEIQPDSGPPFFGTVRLSHISNGGLHHENRGVNSVVLIIGRFF